VNGISVLIVNWNSREDLLRCLGSLEAQTDREFEVVVVDNGSSDGSVEAVRASFPSAKLVETGANLGFAEACNRGLDVCTGEWIVTLNNDARADPAFIARLREAAAAGGPRLGMVQALIVFDREPPRTNSTGVVMRGDGAFVDRDFDAPPEESSAAGEVFCVSAGAALYRRAMLDEIRLSTGVFDRTFFMYFEDVDLGWRARLAGWEARYVPEAIVHHRFHASSGRRGRHFVALHCYRNRLRTLLKNGSWARVVRTVPHSALYFARAIYAGGPAEIPRTLRAVVDGLRQRREVEQVGKLSRGDVERRWGSGQTR
jgi:GT2 family glycosyltransferase